MRPCRPQKACLAVWERLFSFLVVDIVVSAFQTLSQMARLSHKLNQVSQRLQSLPLFSGDQQCPKGSLFLLYSNTWSKKKRKSNFTIHADYMYKLSIPQSKAYLQTRWQFLHRRAVITFGLFPLQKLSLLLFYFPLLFTEIEIATCLD